MEKFCEFRLHEYMDMYPTTHVRTFIADSLNEIEVRAKKYAQRMNGNYSGGTTTFIKVMNAEEARKHLDNIIADEKRHWQSDSQSWIDSMEELYSKCYK